MEGKPPPITDPRTLFLVNTLIIHTVRLLNNFYAICEDKLADVHRRILHVDATLKLLEAKLRTIDQSKATAEEVVQIPEPLDLLLLPESPSEYSKPHLSTQSSGAFPNIAGAESKISREDSGITVSASRDQPEFLKVRDDPKYTRFFRMLQMGIPLAAVKIQMGLEGFDGSVLDTPDAPSLQ